MSTFVALFQGSGFFSIVQVGNKTASSKISHVTKKKAEQIAAREALLSIGVSNPEEAYNNKAVKKSKLKRKFAPTADHQRTSWVHSRGWHGLHSSEWYGFSQGRLFVVTERTQPLAES